MVWQSPANDWGDEPGGYDLSEAKRLTFWARGKEGGEIFSCGVGLLGRDKEYHDSDRVKMSDITLTTEWQKYELDLRGRDLRHIKTGFFWVIGGKDKPFAFYLDEIRFDAEEPEESADPAS